MGFIFSTGDVRFPLSYVACTKYKGTTMKINSDMIYMLILAALVIIIGYFDYKDRTTGNYRICDYTGCRNVNTLSYSDNGCALTDKGTFCGTFKVNKLKN